jgi:hypothetical protein
MAARSERPRTSEQLPVSRIWHLVVSATKPAATAACGVNDDFAVFLGERATLRFGQDLQHDFGGPAEPDAEWADNERAVDEDWMRHHGINQLFIAQYRSQAEFRIGRIIASVLR